MNKLAVFLLLITASLSAQDFGFGFGDDEETSVPSGRKLSASIGGEASSSIVGYPDDFSKGVKHVKLGEIFTGNIKVSAQSSIADGFINLKIQTIYSPETREFPINVDEAYLRAYFGRHDIEAGLRKLTWGKADSLGPLDVINPLDTSMIYTEMADNISLLGVKIARPMIHASFRFGKHSKIEAVFIPNFEGHYIPTAGSRGERWEPSQMKELANFETQEEVKNLISLSPPPPGMDLSDILNVNEQDTKTIDYAQGGLRYTAAIGSADIGAQYYYGRLPQPAAKITNGLVFKPVTPENSNPFLIDWEKSSITVDFLYNPYHQIGIDYAQVLFGFNIRAEVAANITEDLKGNDGSVYNPSIAWSVGFDRDLFWGINLNLQANESIRLLQKKLGNGEFMSVVVGGRYDIEGGKPMTSTRINAALSKKFLRDELEFRTAVAWGVEDKDCLIIPALIWTRDELRVALSAGIFAGDSEGQLGQYKDNNFIKVSCKYTF